MSWEDFYSEHLPPTDFEDNRSILKDFCDRHEKLGTNIVLVTVSKKEENSISPDPRQSILPGRSLLESCINNAPATRSDRYHAAQVIYTFCFLLCISVGGHHGPTGAQYSAVCGQL